MKHHGVFAAPFLGIQTARRAFGVGARWSKPGVAAARESDRAPERPVLRVGMGIIFFLGLGIIAEGILVARGESQFEWFPKGLLEATGSVLENSQAVFVGAAITLVGAVAAGLAARGAKEK